ncbi:hypothetical protein SAMN04488040_0019 [Sulfitobacter marinus]|uniref:Uncharacterized protein n=1 Tax=Sulfitobacter marinus TaxID=394264 RepID=A0A1I6VT31_9RHOB|nr:hypothetical protein [Sulfitobacter marinus]SFT16875.1 hypothetical protein SAMN04488040_0019 [Sulfitobacter marinus]
MDELAPLFVDIDLPDAVILRDTAAPTGAVSLAIHPNDAEAVWYRGHEAAMTLSEGGAITGWTPENGLGITARPAKPNQDHARPAPEGGVVFIREVNCGLVVNAAVVEAEQFCCALRLRSPDAQARTLVTLNPADGDNYLFLSEKDGVLEWRDDTGSIELSLPAPGPDMWVLAGYDHGKLSLTASKTGMHFPAPQITPDASTSLNDALTGPNDLFVGCRSHRKGIVKTLGSSVINDVLLWLDNAGTTADDLAKIARACRFVETQGNAS